MKTTVLLSVLIFGFIKPAFSQLNLHRKAGTIIEKVQIPKNEELNNYNFIGKLSSPWSSRALGSFNMPSKEVLPGKLTRQIPSRNAMPCFHPKSGDNIPCLKPDGNFPMRVFKPSDVIWGILW